MGSGWVPAPGVVVVISDALERRSLVDRYTGAAMLVLVVGIRRVYGRTQCGETVGLPRSSQRRGVWFWSGEIMGGRLLEGAGRRHGRRVERSRERDRRRPSLYAVLVTRGEVRPAFGFWRRAVGPFTIPPHHVTPSYATIAPCSQAGANVFVPIKFQAAAFVLVFTPRGCIRRGSEQT